MIRPPWVDRSLIIYQMECNSSSNNYSKSTKFDAHDLEGCVNSFYLKTFVNSKMFAVNRFKILLFCSDSKIQFHHQRHQNPSFHKIHDMIGSRICHKFTFQKITFTKSGSEMTQLSMTMSEWITIFPFKRVNLIISFRLQPVL